MNMASVREEAERVEATLVNDLEVITGRGYKRCLVQRIHIFLHLLENGFYIRVGSFKNITQSFLFNFYGIITTYIAILKSSASFF